jgi:membrane-bound lytic murein transglycosylase D
VTPLNDDEGEIEGGGVGTTGVSMPQASVTKASRDKPRKPTSYTVKRGETLTAIAQKFQCDMGDLAKANKLKAPRYSIRPGQKLKLNGCEG